MRKIIPREEEIKEHHIIKLTDAEVLEKSKELAAVLKEAGERESQFKFLRSGHNEIMKDLRLQSKQLGEIIGKGEESRHITVLKKYDYEAGEITTINKETGAVLVVRPMSDEEKQLVLKTVEPAAATNEEEKPKSKKEREIADVINLETRRKTKRNAIDT